MYIVLISGLLGDATIYGPFKAQHNVHDWVEKVFGENIHYVVLKLRPI